MLPSSCCKILDTLSLRPQNSALQQFCRTLPEPQLSTEFTSPSSQTPPGVSLIKTGYQWSSEGTPALSELPLCSGKMGNLPDSSLLGLQGKQHQTWLKACFWSFPPFTFPVPKTIFPGLLNWLDKDQLLLHHQHSKEETQKHWWSSWSVLISQL